MVYPESAKAKGFATKAWNLIVGQSSKEEALYVPDHDTMQEKALEVFLENYRSVLVECELSHHRDIVQIAKQIALIFRQLYLQRISHSRDNAWIADKLPAVSFRIVCARAQIIYVYVYSYLISMYTLDFLGNESVASVRCRRFAVN
jgi:hypothetical protein